MMKVIMFIYPVQEEEGTTTTTTTTTTTRRTRANVVD
jgi:hypothetical protein